MVSTDRYQEWRAKFIDRTLLVFFIVLGLRLFQMQVLRGSVYHEKSESNHIRQIPLPASRGLIMDRNGSVLADNRPSYSLYIVPYEFRKNAADAEVIATTLGLSVSEIEKQIKESDAGPFTPVRLIQDMDFKTLSIIVENRLDLPGVFYQAEPVRFYPAHAKCSHIIGYLGEIDKNELKSLESHGYNRGDQIGKTGLEKKYDHWLRGENGYKYAEVDVRGREIGNFEGKRDVPSVPGHNLKLTLDSELQDRIENLMEGRRGAVIVVDPRNGEVLSMVSKPDYDLNSFAVKLNTNLWKQLQNDPGKPLLDRAIQAQLPPGSTYKLITAIAALERKSVPSDFETVCDGNFRLGRRIYHCWKKDGHGRVNFTDAIVGSCNVYFYELMLQTGLESWIDYSELFGFGRKTGIDLEEENSGLLPDIRYLNQKYGKRGWGKGMWLNLTVGQGDLLVTPIQMVMLASEIGMEGRVAVPHLLQAIQDPMTAIWKEFEPEKREIMPVSPETYDQLKTAMFGVVHASGGTGVLARVPGVRACGKTGTAQNPQGEDHAWFIGFAPMEHPEISLVVLIENGGSGGGTAAPIAGSIFRWFLKTRKMT
jgi:penicillin-binding protein 2